MQLAIVVTAMNKTWSRTDRGWWNLKCSVGDVETASVLFIIKVGEGFNAQSKQHE